MGARSLARLAAFAAGSKGFGSLAEIGRRAHMAGLLPGLPLYIWACRKMLACSGALREERHARWRLRSGFPSPGWGARLGPKPLPSMILEDPECPWGDPRCHSDLLALAEALASSFASHEAAAVAAGHAMRLIPQPQAGFRMALAKAMDRASPGWESQAGAGAMGALFSQWPESAAAMEASKGAKEALAAQEERGAIELALPSEPAAAEAPRGRAPKRRL